MNAKRSGCKDQRREKDRVAPDQPGKDESTIKRV